MLPYIFTGDIPEYRFPFCLFGVTAVDALCQFIDCYPKPPKVLVVNHESMFLNTQLSEGLPILSECIDFDICTRDIEFLKPSRIRAGGLDALFEYYDIIIFTQTAGLSVYYFELAAKYQTLIVVGNELRFMYRSKKYSSGSWCPSIKGLVSPTTYACLSDLSTDLIDTLLYKSSSSKLWISSQSPFAYKEF